MEIADKLYLSYTGACVIAGAGEMLINWRYGLVMIEAGLFVFTIYQILQVTTNGPEEEIQS